MKIISHPDKLLIIHLREVALFCAETMENQHFSIDINPKILRDIAYIQGAVHDIGKATRNFQIYIDSRGKTVIPPKHHALISAFVAKQIVIQYLDGQNLDSFDRQILPYFIFTSVKRHHGNIHNFDQELETLNDKKEDLEILVNNFYDDEVQIILNDLLSEVGIQFDWKAFKIYMQDLESVFSEFANFSAFTFLDEFDGFSHVKKAQYYYLHQLLFSCLLFSDKTDVKLGQQKMARSQAFDFAAIKAFRIAKKFNNPSKKIDQLKNQAYFEGLDFLKNNFNPKQHLYAITLPTGLGKTITSLALAMEMKNRLKEQNPRLIITIPFTSIIDQNYHVFNQIFKSPNSNILLKHHHLAEPIYKLSDDTVKESEVEKGKFLIETWQSEIVVTTFVQLLEGIFTNRNGKLLKMPNLLNSIIILDEIQQVKYELWELIRLAFKVLGEKYNCYFILMSATQPLIFEPQKEILELIPNYQQYFKFFNRTQLINRTKTIVNLAHFSKLVFDFHMLRPEHSILVILNTKKTTLQCFQQLVASIPKENANLYFLSTSLTPYERKQIIERIKNPLNNLPNIIISTQLIEAGVDISVNTVFRALAPIDSIIQAAGRANRYSEHPTPSKVYLYQIEEMIKDTNNIYGKNLILKTLNVLDAITTIQEKDYLQIIEAYFHEVRKQSDDMVSEEVEQLVNLKFEDLGKFNFIEYRKTASVYVQLNLKAKKMWEAYKDIYKNNELSIFQKREQFALIKADFYDFVINVPVPFNEVSISFDSEPEMHFYLSEMENPSQCYHYNENDLRENTGYQALASNLRQF